MKFEPYLGINRNSINKISTFYLFISKYREQKGTKQNLNIEKVSISD